MSERRRTYMILVRVVCVALLATSLLTTGSSAEAHTRSRSFSTWRVTDSAVDVVFSVRSYEATRLPRAPGERRELAELLAAHVDAQVAVARDGRPCAARTAARALQAREGYLRVERGFDCAGEGPVSIESGAFFTVAASHVHIARVSFEGGRPIEYLLTDDDRTRTVEPGDAAGGGAASVAAYVVLGVEHILAGIDHLAFLLALLLLCRRVRDVVWLVTGFTLGHSLTLALAVLGFVEPDELLVESLIGFTIALVAVENVAVTTGRSAAFGIGGALVFLALAAISARAAGPPATTLVGLALFTGCYLPLADTQESSTRLRPVLTVMFGLVHGFGFAGVLGEIGLPPDRTLAALFGFNVGVELGQLAVVALFAGAGIALSRFARGRVRRDASGNEAGSYAGADQGVERVTAAASAVLCGLGLFWFFSRAYV